MARGFGFCGSHEVAAGAELRADGGDGVAIESASRGGKDGGLLGADVVGVERAQAAGLFKQSLLQRGFESGSGVEPGSIEAIDIVMEGVGFAMIVLEMVEWIESAGGGQAAHAREEGFLLVGGVAAATFAEIGERGADGGGFFAGEGAGVGALGDVAEDGEEALDAAMTIVEHAERVVEAAVEFGADLNGHGETSELLSCEF